MLLVSGMTHVHRRFTNLLLGLIVAAACACDDDDDGGGGDPRIDAGTPPAVGIDAVEQLSPAEGWTVNIPPFDVPAGAEITDCYFLAFPDLGEGRSVWVDRIKIGQRPGSHHMNIFRVTSETPLNGEPGDVVRDGECKILPNWADWPLVANSQESDPDSPPFEWRLPDGVAMPFAPGELLMLQTHYVNSSDQPSPAGGEVRVNFYLADEVAPMELGTLMGREDSIRICQSDPQVSFSGQCVIPSDTTLYIAAANGHFHSRGDRVAIATWDGDIMSPPAPEAQFYESLRWDDAPMTTGLDVAIRPGGGIWWTCEYTWSPPSTGCDEVNRRDPEMAGDCCYTFGNTAEAAEHCNVFVYYWPKVDQTAVYCY